MELKKVSPPVNASRESNEVCPLLIVNWCGNAAEHVIPAIKTEPEPCPARRARQVEPQFVGQAAHLRDFELEAVHCSHAIVHLKGPACATLMARYAGLAKHFFATDCIAVRESAAGNDDETVLVVQSPYSGQRQIRGKRIVEVPQMVWGENGWWKGTL
jgi:hypothetical protein